MQKKAQSAVKRINNQLPRYAKLNKHQEQRIRSIVENHQTRLTPLRKDLKQTKGLLRHQSLNKRKNGQKIKQLRNKKHNISYRIKDVRKHQKSQINRVLNQQHQYLKQKQLARKQWQQGKARVLY